MLLLLQSQAQADCYHLASSLSTFFSHWPPPQFSDQTPNLNPRPAVVPWESPFHPTTLAFDTSIRNLLRPSQKEPPTSITNPPTYLPPVITTTYLPTSHHQPAAATATAAHTTRSTDSCAKNSFALFDTRVAVLFFSCPFASFPLVVIDHFYFLGPALAQAASHTFRHRAIGSKPPWESPPDRRLSPTRRRRYCRCTTAPQHPYAFVLVFSDPVHCRTLLSIENNPRGSFFATD